MASQATSDLKIPVFVVGAVIVAIVALVAGLIIGGLLPASATAAPDSLSGWITTIATAVICVLTIILAIETWRLRAAQTRQIKELYLEGLRPNVGIELSPSHAGFHFMNVQVSNSGKGIAKKISFEFLDRDDQPATALSAPIIKVFHKLAMFRIGIQSLGINQALKSFIFSFLEIEGQLGVGVFTPYVNIRIRFEDTEGNEYTNVFVIDFSQYEGFTEVGSEPLSEIAKEMKAIRSELSKVISGSARLDVDVHSAADRVEERAALLRRLAEERELEAEQQRQRDAGQPPS
jgi:hypothetical protein